LPIGTFARIAQSVEQGIENPRVGGSNPSPGTIFEIRHIKKLEKTLWPVVVGGCFLVNETAAKFSGLASGRTMIAAIVPIIYELHFTYIKLQC
jgi:hypothetical protein